MDDRLIPIADGFHNLRGTFRIARVFNIGVQSSLVRRPSGRFVLLDSYPLRGAVRDEVFALTDGGRAIEAVLNLHPFHTVFVAALHADLPHATLYGTARHRSRAPDLPWAEEVTEGGALHARFADTFDFLVPRGVDLVTQDPRVHFASVLAVHRASRTLHVDDTLGWSTLPLVGGLAFHPMLRQALQPRAGAAADFRAWARELIDRLTDVEHLCTAHLPPLPPAGAPYAAWVERALHKVEPVLARHEARWG